MSRAEAQRTLLTRLQQVAREHTATAINYTRPVSNGPVFRRLLSDVGLPSGLTMGYVTPAESNLSDLATDPNTEVRRVVLAPYGLADDAVVLSRNGPQDRRIHQGPNQTGATSFASVRQYVHSATLARDTLGAASKTVSQISAMVAPNGGVSAHFVVTRTGLIIQVAALDDVVLGITETGFWQSNKPSDLLICYESALLALADDFRNGRNNFIEAPLLEIQTNAIAFLIAKLAVAFNISPIVGYASRAGNVRPGFTTLNALQKSANETVDYVTFAFQDDPELRTETPTGLSQAETQLRALYGQTSSLTTINTRIAALHFDNLTDIYQQTPSANTEDVATTQAALRQRNPNDVQAFTENATGYLSARMRALAVRQITDAQTVSLRIAEHLVARDTLRTQTLNLALSDDDSPGRTGNARNVSSPGGGELFDFATGHWTGNGRNVV